MSNRVITLGEIMLRLKSPGFERLLQTPIFEATFGGGEANVAISLALYGLDSAFVTVLPKNPIADSCIDYLRSKNVDVSLIQRGGERLGIFFLESGTNQRPSRVFYDRSFSAISKTTPEDMDWNQIFKNASWFHITGITPAISQSAADLSLLAVQEAKARGIIISCDYNYRSKLWNYGRKTSEVMSELVRYVDYGIANEEDCQHSLGISVNTNELEDSLRNDQVEIMKYRILCERVFEVFPNLKSQAITLRESINANHNRWSAFMYNGDQFFISKRYEITDIVDRVGAGDSFSAGLIYGLVTKMSTEEALNFAVAASCLKHTIPGDINLISVDEVMRLLNGEGTGRIQR